MTNESSLTKHPTHASSGIALFAGLCTTALSTSHSLQLSIVGVEAIGTFLLLGSSIAQQRGSRVWNRLLLLIGSSIVCIALGLGFVFPGSLINRVAFLGGLLGPVLLILAVYPLRPAWSRPTAGFGTALLVSSVLIRGWLGQIGQIQLLGAVVMAVLAWDGAEQAIALGNDVGRGARTLGVVILHTISSLTVGIVAIIITTGVYGTTPTSIPLLAVAFLFGATAILILSIYLPNLRRDA